MYPRTAIYVSSDSGQAVVNIRAGVKLTKSSMFYIYILILRYTCVLIQRAGGGEHQSRTYADVC